MSLTAKILLQFAVKAANEALGIPDRKRFGDISQIPKDQLIKWVIQHHDAQRAGKHFDVRMGTPQTGLYSWATRKELPEPGGKIMLFQQPVHRYDYAGFQGKILSGYGAGTVKTHAAGMVGVQEAANDKIKFSTTHRGMPESFTMIRMTGPRKGTSRTERTQGGSWLLANTTPVQAPQLPGIEGAGMAQLPAGAVPVADSENPLTQSNVIQSKMASLVSIIRKRRGRDDSRRPS